MENIQICCSDILTAGACDEFILNLDMWVEDEQGNSTVCKTTVIIQDDLDACACQSTGNQIKGFIGNNCNIRSEANLKLSGPNNYYRETFGPFIRFYELINGQYQLCLERNDYPLNGVTTGDIVKIQRHILGIESFNNYAQILAADVTNSNSITAADVTEIRRLILGVKSKFTNVSSWIFAPSDSLINLNHTSHVNDFKNGCWDLNINSASHDNLSFTSIKMGDVNCTARLSDQNKTENRNTSIGIKYSSISLDNQSFSTTFKLDKDLNVQGFQFTLQFDPALFEFDKMQSGDITILDDQILFTNMDNGRINIAWDQNQLNKNHLSTGNLFSILWKRKTQTSKFPVLNFDAEGIKPLIINENLNELDLILSKSEPVMHSDFQVIQDQNSKQIYLQYSIEGNMNIDYSLLDINGRVVIQKKLDLKTGSNREYIPLENIPENGLYLLSIYSGSFLKSFKVFILN